MNARFFYDAVDVALIDHLDVQTDPDQDERNRQRAREVIERMGEKWCFYRKPTNVKQLRKKA
jgi:hypothetical protein